jgi:hypothetical protein
MILIWRGRYSFKRDEYHLWWLILELTINHWRRLRPKWFSGIRSRLLPQRCWVWFPGNAWSFPLMEKEVEDIGTQWLGWQPNLVKEARHVSYSASNTEAFFQNRDFGIGNLKTGNTGINTGFESKNYSVFFIETGFFFIGKRFFLLNSMFYMLLLGRFFLIICSQKAKGIQSIIFKW